MKLFFIILMIPFTLYSFHEYPDKNKSLNNEKNVSLEKTLSSAEPTLNYIYKSVNEVAKSVDEFLSNDYTETTYTDSYIHIQTSLSKEESSSTNFNTNLDIRLKLKKTNEKYRLFINNSDDNISDKFEDSNETVPFKDDNYNIGIQYQMYKKYINFKASVGVKTSTNPYIYIKSSANRDFKITEKSKINIKQLFRYSNEFKLDSTSIIQYDREINQTYAFVNYNNYFLNSQNKIDYLYNSIKINQKLNSRNYINYVIALNSDNNKSKFQDKEYKAYFSYRNFIKKWVYYDLIPEVNFQRENNFDKRYQFIINLGILIDK